MVISLVVLYATPALSQTETGVLSVKKLSPDAPAQEFSFTSNNTPSNFTLSDDDTQTFNVEVGTSITITETVPDDWYLEKINCDASGGTAVVDLANNRVTMTLTSANTTFGCNFDNELPDPPLNTGRLIVEKKAPDVP
ncbi:MAG: prealbumin-like fold domain-containing protein, partial [Acidimicrobiia bacterium]